MIQQAELLEKIGTLPPEYFGEVFDFAEFLQQKARLETAEEETERINRNARPAPKSSDRATPRSDALKRILSQPTPLADSLAGVLRGAPNMTAKEIRAERLEAKYGK